MLVIREISSNHGYQLHCIIEQPQRIGFKKFTHLIETVWKSTDFDYEKIYTEFEENWTAFCKNPSSNES